MQDMTTLRIEINVKNRIYLEEKERKKGWENSENRSLKL